MTALMAQKTKAEEEAARALKDKISLEQEVAALKARIKQLESNNSAASNASQRVGQLQKQLKSTKSLSTEQAESKACVVS